MGPSIVGSKTQTSRNEGPEGDSLESRKSTDTAEPIKVGCSSDIPDSFGKLREVVGRGTVGVREPIGTETFHSALFGDETAVPGVHVVVVLGDGREVPIARQTFGENFEEVIPGRFRRSTRMTVVQIQEGVTVLVGDFKTGWFEERHPNYLLFDERGRVVSVKKPEELERNFEFLIRP
jgi:hypothetical protein